MSKASNLPVRQSDLKKLEEKIGNGVNALAMADSNHSYALYQVRRELQYIAAFCGATLGLCLAIYFIVRNAPVLANE